MKIIEDTLIKTIGKAFIYTICVVTTLCILLSLCNGNEMFITLFIFGIGIIFTMFLCTLLIIRAIKSNLVVKESTKL